MSAFKLTAMSLAESPCHWSAPNPLTLVVATSIFALMSATMGVRTATVTSAATRASVERPQTNK